MLNREEIAKIAEEVYERKQSILMKKLNDLQVEFEKMKEQMKNLGEKYEILAENAPGFSSKVDNKLRRSYSNTSGKTVVLSKSDAPPLVFFLIFFKIII